MKCPYCCGENHRQSYMSSTLFNSKKFDYLSCTNCDVIYVHPFPNEEDYIAMYPPSYQGELINSKNLIYDKIFDKIKTFSINAENILDYGCGYGELLFHADQKGFKTYGVEYNEKYIEILKKRYKQTSFMSISEFDSSVNFYDIIILNNVLEHVANPNELLQKLKSKLNDKGILVVIGPIENNFTIAQSFRQFFFTLKRKIKNNVSNHPPYHITFTNYDNQLEIFGRNGYKFLLFETSESAWPFPEKISLKSFGFFIKSIIAFISIKLSPIINKKSGNTFIYIGGK
jgi:2-polyprenyl-3-methyl-5-hydroxy-6-metoxy-1,4-benzoquinol methylase